MKNYKLLLAIVFSVVVTATIFGFKGMGENGSGGILTMEVVGGVGLVMPCYIHIVYEDGKEEKIELKKPKVSDPTENSVLINQVLNQLRTKGYKLISFAPELGGSVTIYIFEKE